MSADVYTGAASGILAVISSSESLRKVVWKMSVLRALLTPPDLLRKLLTPFWNGFSNTLGILAAGAVAAIIGWSVASAASTKVEIEVMWDAPAWVAEVAGKVGPALDAATELMLAEAEARREGR